MEKLNETKDQFITITQHSLRTPVTTIKWEIDSLLNEPRKEIGPKTRKTLENTMDSIDSLVRILNDFLSITALKTGSQILNLKRTSIKQIVKDVIHELKIDLEQQNIKTSYPSSRENWPELNIDANKIKEVIFIILENAIRYNREHGEIKITTSTTKDHFKLSIENSGIGISHEEKENIFERLFYRGKNALNTNPRGMGVGLGVAKAIIMAHHGNIDIFSDGEDKGARVEITLPFNTTSSFSATEPTK